MMDEDFDNVTELTDYILGGENNNGNIRK